MVKVAVIDVEAMVTWQMLIEIAEMVLAELRRDPGGPTVVKPVRTWEGGVRVPFLIRWPAAPGHRVSAEIVDMLDLMPTLAAAAGVTDLAARLA